MNEQHTFIETIKKQTGAKAFINEENEIVVMPEQCNRKFFERLLPAIVDTPFTFSVTRNLEIIIFKP